MLSTEFDPKGVEIVVQGTALVPIGSKLPNVIEVKTSNLIDLFPELSPSRDIPTTKLRTKIRDWLYRRTRPSFYMELSKYLHLAYADQRDGGGTQHWWRLFFDDTVKERVERATKSRAIVLQPKEVGTDTEQPNYINPFADKCFIEWGGMYFRSKAEIKIAEQLDRRGVLFFANVRGRISGEGSPVSVEAGLTGRLELDFLVFYKGKCLSLEVDGRHHEEQGQVTRDYTRDRVLLREGIATARFTANECTNQAVMVVEEFLNMF
jgi:Protein of unknown function (DUF559)